MPTRSAPSRRPATFSIPLSPNAFTTISIRRAARAIRKLPMSPSAAVTRSRTRSCGGGASWTRRRPPEMATARYCLISLLLVGAWLLGPTAAQAHPDVWIISTSELIYAPDGSLTGVRHAWTFDDMFTRGALQEVENKTKGVYTSEELAPLARINAESLKEFGYFTFAKADGKRAKFDEPVDYFMEYSDGALTLHFTLPLTAPVRPKEFVIEVFDPTSFADFKFAEKQPVMLIGAPASCKLDVQRTPMAGSPGAKASGQTVLDHGEDGDSGAVFTNRITVACP